MLREYEGIHAVVKTQLVAVIIGFVFILQMSSRPDRHRRKLHSKLSVEILRGSKFIE